MAKETVFFCNWEGPPFGLGFLSLDKHYLLNGSLISKIYLNNNRKILYKKKKKNNKKERKKVNTHKKIKISQKQLIKKEEKNKKSEH